MERSRGCAQGPTPAPSAPLRADVTAHAALVADHELLESASRRAAAGVQAAFIRGSDAIGDALRDALGTVLADARPDATLLESFAFSDPTALHRAHAPVQVAWSRLAELAARHDAIRRAALGLHEVLDAPGINDAARSAAAERFDVDAFVGFGLVGPAAHLRGTGSPDLAPRWAWQRGPLHPVARLVAAALAPEPEPAPEVVDGAELEEIPVA